VGVARHITAVVVAVFACFCAWYVYVVMGRKAGVTEQELATPLTASVTACGGFIMALFNAAWYFFYDRDDLKAWREERRKQAGPQFHTLLDRIKRESGNFDKLREGKPPFSEYTEVTPFELLERDLKPVSDQRGYRRLVNKLLAEISRVQAMPRGQKDVTVFLPLVERLEKMLEADVKGYPKTK
jgi:hypothetical protein